MGLFDPIRSTNSIRPIQTARSSSIFGRKQNENISRPSYNSDSKLSGFDWHSVDYTNELRCKTDANFDMDG